MLLSCLYDLFPAVLKTVDAHPCTTLPSPSPRTVHLPLELGLQILEQAYESEANPSQLLKNCSLVCRAWSYTAQKLLFRDVALSSQAACNAFLAAVDPSTPRGAMLANAVLRMKVVVDHNDPSCVSREAFADVVTSCPNLCAMDVALYGRSDEVGGSSGAPSFDESTLNRLRNGPACIRSLHFNNSSDSDASFFQLLDIWPSLNSLAVSGTPPKLPTSLPPFRGVLEELRVNCQSPLSLDFVKWVLGNSSERLRTLEFEREQPNEVVDYLVEAHGATLRSLALPACTTHDMAQAVRKCVALEELRIEHPWITPVLYKPFPSQLRRIAIAIDQDTGLQPVLDVVRNEEALKAVTLQVWDSGDRNTQLPFVKLACAFRGIDLKMTKDIKVFRSVVRREPVAPSPFARTNRLEK
ncbi:hypothetical protein C8F01DRAFT_1107444 [Mycena amicta]|nr:hypothetical protein C8F01DRAFT_1107444 [Mycena amicta]